MGTRLAADKSSAKVATINGAGGVNVGKRVGATGLTNAASNVGLIFTIGVEAGVGVGGALSFRNSPDLTILT